MELAERGQGVSHKIAPRVSLALRGKTAVSTVIALGRSNDAAAQIESAALKEAINVPVQGDLEKASGLLKANRLEEASVFALRALKARPGDPEAVELYVRIKTCCADERGSRGEWADALDACKLGAAAADQSLNALLTAADADPSAVRRITAAKASARQKLLELAESIVGHAEALYSEGKGKHWYNNDDEAKFIDALVLLDAVPVDDLPVSMRSRHASLWTTCYSELGKADIETYKLKTAITNGRKG